MGNLEKSEVIDVGFEYINFGFVKDQNKIGLVYSSADVYVAPSLAEAFGKTIAESMLCKTPVVCFDATGPKEIVDHQINGYKAKAYYPEDLAKGIEWICNSNEYEKLAENARKKAIKTYDNLLIAKRYIQLYNEIYSTQNG